MSIFETVEIMEVKVSTRGRFYSAVLQLLWVRSSDKYVKKAVEHTALYVTFQ